MNRRHARSGWRTILLLTGHLILPAVAGEPGIREAGTGEPLVQGIPWRWYWESGGWILYVLLAFSIFTVAVIFYLFAVLRPGPVLPASLRRELEEKIRVGAWTEALRACVYRPCPLAAVFQAVLQPLESSRTVTPVELREALESEGSRQADALQSPPQYLLDLAVIAPMVGFLGTVWGMMQAFGAISLNVEHAQPVVLANGVAQALVTTVGGLMIAIPAMMFYAYFRRRAMRLIARLETVSDELFALLLTVLKTTP